MEKKILLAFLGLFHFASIQLSWGMDINEEPYITMSPDDENACCFSWVKNILNSLSTSWTKTAAQEEQLIELASWDEENPQCNKCSPSTCGYATFEGVDCAVQGVNACCKVAAHINYVPKLSTIKTLVKLGAGSVLLLYFLKVNLEDATLDGGVNGLSAESKFNATIAANVNTHIDGELNGIIGSKKFGFDVPLLINGLTDAAAKIGPIAVVIMIPVGAAAACILPGEGALWCPLLVWCCCIGGEEAYGAIKEMKNRPRPIKATLATIEKKIRNLFCCCKNDEEESENCIATFKKNYPKTTILILTVNKLAQFGFLVGVGAGFVCLGTNYLSDVNYTQYFSNATNFTGQFSQHQLGSNGFNFSNNGISAASDLNLNLNFNGTGNATGSIEFGFSGVKSVNAVALLIASALGAITTTVVDVVNCTKEHRE